MTLLPMPMLGETFKAHPVWSAYLVSDHGRVWSTKSNRFVGRACGGGSSDRAPGRPQKYRSVTVNNEGKTATIHVMVLETFVGPRPEGHDADHVNHQPSDNRLSNLRWRIAADNRADRSLAA